MDSATQQFLTPEAIQNYVREFDPAGNANFFERLEGFDVSNLVEGSIRDSDMADCCKSGLWMLHNFLHESHELSQSVHSAEGSWWHAIMHRSEGDFGNAKYWYRQVGDHKAFGDINPDFDPYSFVDLCQHEYRNGLLTDETQKIAFAEWQALFNYCQQNVG